MTKTAMYHLAMCVLWFVALFVIDKIDTRYFVMFALGANVAMLANEFKPRKKDDGGYD